MLKQTQKIQQQRQRQINIMQLNNQFYKQLIHNSNSNKSDKMHSHQPTPNFVSLSSSSANGGPQGSAIIGPSASNSSLQSALRQSFEQSYKQRLLLLKNFYELRNKTLQETLSNSYRKVLQDQLLSTMVRDSTTLTYIQERIKELFKEIVQDEREVLLQKLGLQYAELRFSYNQLQRKNDILKKQQQRNMATIQSFQSQIQTLTTSLQEKSSQLNSLNLQHKQSQNLLQTLTNTLSSTHTSQSSMITQLRQENLYLKMKLEKFQQEVQEAISMHKTKEQLREVDIEDSRKKIGALQGLVKQMEKNGQEKIQLIQKKYRKKINQYKNKIQEYKAKILQIVSKQNPNNAPSTQMLEQRLHSLTNQYEKKLGQQKSSHATNLQTMQKKYEQKYQQLQAYYQSLLEQKIGETQRVAENVADRLKNQEAELRKYVQFLQTNSVPINKFQELQKYSQQLKGYTQNKIIQKKQLQSQFQKMIRQNQHMKKLLEQEQQKTATLQTQLSQISSSLKSLQSELHGSKKIEQSQKSAFMELHTSHSHLQQEHHSLKGEMNRVRNEYLQAQNTIGQLEGTVSTRISQVDNLQSMLEGSTKRCQQMQKSLRDSVAENADLQKQMIGKQKQIQNIVSQYQQKIRSLEIQLQRQRSCSQQLSISLSQCQGTLSSTQSEHKQLANIHLQSQSQVHKLTLQNNFLSQSIKSYQTQHENMLVEQAKANAKHREEQNLIKIDIQAQKEKYSKLAAQAQTRVRKLENGIAKIRRILFGVLRDIAHGMEGISIQVQAYGKLIGMEIGVFTTGVASKIKQYSQKLITNHNIQISQIKSTSHKSLTQIQSSLSTLQSQYNSLSQTSQSQTTQLQSLNQQLCTKDNLIDKLEKEIRRCNREIEENNEKMRDRERREKEMEMLVEAERLQGKGKIGEIIRGFDHERDKIIQQYNSKRQKQQQQLQQLTIHIKQLRQQHQSSKHSQQQTIQSLQSQLQATQHKLGQIQQKLNAKQAQLLATITSFKAVQSSNAGLQTENSKISEENMRLRLIAQALQLKNSQISGQLVLVKAKNQRLTQEMEATNREINSITKQKQEEGNARKQLEGELKQIKIAMNHRARGMGQMKVLQKLQSQTKELTGMVQQMRKVGMMIGGSGSNAISATNGSAKNSSAFMGFDRTPLRS